MTNIRQNLLFVTDLSYVANQRSYADEDIYLTSELRRIFNVILCHPADTEPFESMVDGIIVRNSGPVIHYLDQYEAFHQRCRSNRTPVYNSLDGKADMLGKQYLVDLCEAAYPVIPTISSINQIEILPQAERYVVKPADVPPLTESRA